MNFWIVLSIHLIYVYHTIEVVTADRVSAKNLTIFTNEEKEAVEHLKQIILNDEPIQNLLVHSYMRSDEYLLRWVRARKLDQNAAKLMLKMALEWRKENNIDNILHEKFSFFETRYPYWIDGNDKFNRPVVTIPAGRWDIRKAVLSGQGPKLHRYLTQLLEKATIKAFSISRKNENDDKLKVPLFIIIVDMFGFNARQHACASCLSIYFNFIAMYDQNYPETLGHTILINVPKIFKSLVDIIRPFLRKSMTNINANVNLFDFDRELWETFILSIVPKNQIRKQFGGSL